MANENVWMPETNPDVGAVEQTEEWEKRLPQGVGVRLISRMKLMTPHKRERAINALLSGSQLEPQTVPTVNEPPF